MPNNYFSFKEFTVFQDKCAMKVCTDACIQGAYTSSLIHQKTNNILDIGTGTGLLSLMLAQGCTANITAIELDENACIQANENFRASPWNQRMTVHNKDIRSIHPSFLFDWIICNPPFYENDLQSPDESKNAAMHSTTLKLEELLTCIIHLLSDTGFASVMIPYHRRTYFEKMIFDHKLFIRNELSVQQTAAHGFFRTVFIISKIHGEFSRKTLVIKDEENYTPSFRALMRPYYLNF